LFLTGFSLFSIWKLILQVDKANAFVEFVILVDWHDRRNTNAPFALRRHIGGRVARFRTIQEFNGPEKGRATETL
jgi:hypothetical protein